MKYTFKDFLRMLSVLGSLASAVVLIWNYIEFRKTLNK